MDRSYIARWSLIRNGVLSPETIECLALTRSEQRSLMSAGWKRPHPRVLVDPAVPGSERQTIGIAVAAAGAGCMASHGSAAWLHELVDQSPSPVHVLVPAGRRLRLADVRTHRVTTLPRPRYRHSIPVTDPVRTLIDLAAVGSLSDDVIDRALMLGLTTVDGLDEATRPDHAVRRPGVAALRRSLATMGHLGVPEPSVLESRMARILEDLHRRHGIPRPAAELRWDGGRYRLDFAWPDRLLAVEADGYVWHGSSAAKTADDARRRELAMAGWLILPYSWTEVTRRPTWVGGQILAAYRARSGARS